MLRLMVVCTLVLMAGAGWKSGVIKKGGGALCSKVNGAKSK